MRLHLRGICPMWLVEDSRSSHNPRPEYVRTIGTGIVEVTLQGTCLDYRGLEAFISRAIEHKWDGWERTLARKGPVAMAVTELWEEWR